MSANYYKWILSRQMIVCGCFTVYSLWTTVIQLHIYFKDWLGQKTIWQTSLISVTISLHISTDSILGGLSLWGSYRSFDNTPCVFTGQVPNGFLNTHSICWIVTYIHTFMSGTIQCSKGIKLVYLQLKHWENFRSVPW